MKIIGVYKDNPHIELAYEIGTVIRGSKVVKMHEVFGVRHSVQIYFDNGEMRNIYEPDEVFYKTE